MSISKYFLAAFSAFSFLATEPSIAQLPPSPPPFLTSEQREARRAFRIAEAKQYGDNILRLIPLRSIDGEGVGVGIDYEHIFGAEKNVGLVLPLTINFAEYYDYMSPSQHTATYFYFTPGIKIYPFGQRKVTYAVGPSIMIGLGNVGGYNNYRGYNVSSFQRFRMGVFANNYLNVQLTPQFNFGVELGLGVRYVDVGTKNGATPDYDNGVQPMQNFALSFGYRF